MFQLESENSTYWYPVSVEMVDKDGRKRRFTFQAEFNRLPQDEINEQFRKRDEGEAPIKDAEVLDRVFVGWKDVADADGNPLPVNDANRARLLAAFPTAPSIVKAYLKSLGWEGAAKN